MKCAVIVFPGSNCDRDCRHVVSSVCGQEAELVWHTAHALPQGTDGVILPGGFSYGDYLRAGAIARQSPVLRAVTAFAAAGGVVVGICNGFQVLTEAGLLPGALLRNTSCRFECREIFLRVERTDTPVTCAYADPPSPHGKVPRLRMPIAHLDGNYFVDAETRSTLERHGQIVFRYCDCDGQITDAANPNGSQGNIAGVCNRERNVVGLMPHPERCSESLLGGLDGRGVFASMHRWITTRP